MMIATLPRIGYTLGDQAGVGPELIAACLNQLKEAGVAAEFIELGARVACCPGEPTRATAQAAWDALETAALALAEGRVDALVTGPICKEALHALGFPFPGQTEFFADRLGVAEAAMCLSGEHLTVALATTHVALADVPSILNEETLLSKGRLLAAFLRARGVALPRIAFAGLNPHNGEQGAFGNEEAELLAPCVQILAEEADDAEFCGPIVPDVVYREAAMGRYDGVVAPYHDQALIPLKLIDFDTAVNVTLGLPRLRMSPDHGTAFDIAGKGVANPSSMRHAFNLAIASASC